MLGHKWAERWHTVPKYLGMGWKWGAGVTRDVSAPREGSSCQAGGGQGRVWGLTHRSSGLCHPAHTQLCPEHQIRLCSLACTTAAALLGSRQPKSQLQGPCRVRPLDLSSITGPGCQECQECQGTVPPIECGALTLYPLGNPQLTLFQAPSPYLSLAHLPSPRHPSFIHSLTSPPFCSLTYSLPDIDGYMPIPRPFSLSGKTLPGNYFPMKSSQQKEKDAC